MHCVFSRPITYWIKTQENLTLSLFKNFLTLLKALWRYEKVEEVSKGLIFCVKFVEYANVAIVLIDFTDKIWLKIAK